LFPDEEEENAFASPNNPVLTATALEFEFEILFRNMPLFFCFRKKNFFKFAPLKFGIVRRKISNMYKPGFILIFSKKFSN
jgi:hypothetical protein